MIGQAVANNSEPDFKELLYALQTDWDGAYYRKDTEPLLAKIHEQNPKNSERGNVYEY